MDTAYDLIVVGAGPGGVSAAMAAAIRKQKVLLIERYGFCGGMAASALVGPYAGICWRNPETGKCGDITGGLFRGIRAQLKAEGGLSRELFDPADDFYYETFDENVLKHVLETSLLSAGVKLLYHALLVSAETRDGRVRSVTVATKEGAVVFTAPLFIDSTGDADLLARCGGAFEIGRKRDGLCQPVSLMFRMAGVDKPAVLRDGLKKARENASLLFLRDKADGSLDYPYKAWVQFYDYPRSGQLLFNMTRVLESDALSAEKLSAAETNARWQARAFSRWMASAVPGFRHAWLDVAGAQVGVRETRRIRGGYRLTGDDIREGSRFDDGIARSGYIMDIHDPKSAVDPHIGKEGAQSVVEAFKPKRYYEIPYRALLPEGFDNLIVACRALSATHEAHAAVRVMPTLHAVGEAAGIAAAMAGNGRKSFNAIEGNKIRDELPHLNAPLEF